MSVRDVIKDIEKEKVSVRVVKKKEERETKNEKESI